MDTIFTEQSTDAALLLDTSKVFNPVTRNVFLHNLKLGQKRESQNGCFEKAKHAKISEKQLFLTS